MSRPEVKGFAFNQRLFPKKVPWFNWDEWSDTFEKLYSKDISDRWEGVKTVATWSARGQVPLEIESTANITEILLRDRSSEDPFRAWNLNSNFRSETELQLMYSMAIIRFVNGLVDPEQKFHATSIYLLADKIGLPRSFVDIRHQAAHSSLPNIHLLRKYSNEALIWLKENYWIKQQYDVEGIDEHVLSLLNEYRSIQKQRRNLEDKEKDFELKKNMKNILKEIVEKTPVSSIKELIVDVLIEGNYLVPKSKKYREYSELPERFEQLWIPALFYFHKKWPLFTPTLFSALVETIITASKIPDPDVRMSEKQRRENSKKFMYRQCLLTCWLDFISKGKYRFNFDQKNAPTILPIKQAIEACLKNYQSEWSKTILTKMMAMSTNSTEFAEKISHLGSLKLQTIDIHSKSGTDSPDLISPDSSQNIGEKQLDLEDFELMLKKRKRENSQIETSSKWVQMIHEGPIGEIIGGSIFDLILPELDLPENRRKELPKPIVQVQSEQQEEPMQDDVVSLPPQSEWSEYEINMIKKEVKLIISWEEINNLKKVKFSSMQSPNKV